MLSFHPPVSLGYRLLWEAYTFPGLPTSEGQKWFHQPGQAFYSRRCRLFKAKPTQARRIWEGGGGALEHRRTLRFPESTEMGNERGLGEDKGSQSGEIRHSFQDYHRHPFNIKLEWNHWISFPEFSFSFPLHSFPFLSSPGSFILP